MSNSGKYQTSWPNRRTVCATNLYASGTTNAIPSTSGTSRSPHKTTFAVSDLQLVYANSFVNSSLVDTPGANTLTVNASVEYAGTIYRVTFSGRTSATIDPSAVVYSDPLGIEIPANTLFYVRTWVSASAAPMANLASYGSSGTGGWTLTTDLTAPGSLAIADSINWLYSPYAIVGTPDKPTDSAVIVLGDSIAAGVGDNAASGAQYSEYGNGGGQAGGFISRGLGSTTARVNIANPSDKAANFIILGNHLRVRFAENCTHAICEFGVNDVTAGTALSTIQSNLLTIWTILASRGLKVFQTTITPVSTSSDSFATTVNQTTNANNATRVSLNQWIRTKPVPLTGFIEASWAAESTPDSGIWKANYTGDGTHPNSTGAAAIAQAVANVIFS